jgi:hypothetical protein
VEDPGRRRTMKIDLVRLHLTQSALAGQYEIDGDIVAADQLRAFCRLRLCTLGNDFLGQLASAMATTVCPAGQVIQRLVEARNRAILEANEWIGDVYGTGAKSWRKS